MLELLHRVYQISCNSLSKIKNRNLKNLNNIEDILSHLIEERVMKDDLVSNFLYKNLKNYLSGIYYLSLKGKNPIYIRIEDKVSPFCFGRKAREREISRTFKLSREYRNNYE